MTRTNASKPLSSSSPPSDDHPSSFGHFIRQEREKKRLSQKELASRAGVSVVTVSRIERGETSSTGMRKNVLSGLATALFLPLDTVKRVAQGESISWSLTRVCQECWVPGTEPDSRWKGVDSCFCARCGDPLTSVCRCGEPLILKAKFCPECGHPYGQRGRDLARAALELR